MRGDFESGITHRPERKRGVVKINQVGVELVDQIHRAVVKLVAIRLVGPAGAVALVPQRNDVPHFKIIPTARMVLAIQILRIESVPPQTFAVGFRKPAVVILRQLESRPGVGGMNAHAKTQTSIARGLCPAGDQILLRSHVH